MENTYAHVIADIKPEGEGFVAPLPDTWKQGRTCYGGLTAALLHEAALRNVPDLPPLRSATIDFVGPITEPPVYTASLLRQGRSVTSVEARAAIGDQVVAVASMSFGAARESAIVVECPAPPTPRPDEVEPYVPPGFESFAPSFFGNFEARLIEGGRPADGTDQRQVRCWVRHKDAESRGTVGSQLCLGDALPPVALALSTTLGPASSIRWLYNRASTDLTTEDGWWLLSSEITSAGEGYSTEVMRIWSSDGRLVVDGQQMVAQFV